MKVQSLSMNDQLKLVQNDCDAHGQQLQKFLSNVILKKNDRNTPTAAEVLVASSSRTDTPAVVLHDDAQLVDHVQQVQHTTNKSTCVNQSAAPKQLMSSQQRSKEQISFCIWCHSS